MANEWAKWFAWYPVEVDAYKIEEIKNGRMRYKVWGKWVERRVIIRTDEDGNLEENIKINQVIQYRLPQG